jgi:hypothetical protein
LCLIPGGVSGALLKVEQVSQQQFLPNTPWSSVPAFTNFIVYHNELYFTASTASDGQTRLFKTDGQQVKEFDVSPFEFTGLQFIEFKDQLYFAARGEAYSALYRTDGRRLTKIDVPLNAPGSFGWNFANDGQFLYFGGASNPEQPEVRSLLFRTDGKTVEQVADVSTENSFPWTDSAGGGVYFTANGPAGFELYRGQGSGMHLVADINPGLANGDAWFGAQFKDAYYFTARDAEGWNAYRTKGLGVEKLSTAAEQLPFGNPSNFLAVGEALYFGARGPNGHELFRTNGQDVDEIDLLPGPADSWPQVYDHAILPDNRVVMPGKGAEGPGLYVINGTQPHFLHLTGDSFKNWPTYLRQVDSQVCFVAEGSHGIVLFRTDGVTITELNLMPDGNSDPTGLFASVSFHDALYFISQFDGHPRLIRADHSSVEVIPLSVTAEPVYAYGLTVLGDFLIFEATGPDGHGVYQSDGHSVQLLADLYPGSEEMPGYQGNFPSLTEFTKFNGAAYFIARTQDGFFLHRITAVPEPHALGCWLAAWTVLSRRRRNYP